jgi:hypothetical protein
LRMGAGRDWGIDYKQKVDFVVYIMSEADLRPALTNESFQNSLKNAAHFRSPTSATP